MSTYDNAPPLDGWACCPHRECPCMETPANVPTETHIVRGSE